MEDLEVAAALDDAGPVAAAKRWMRMVCVDKDLCAAWPATDESARRALADLWVHAALGDDPAGRDIVEALAALPPASSMWERFEVDTIEVLVDVVLPTAGFDLDGWGVSLAPEPRSLDHVVVVFLDCEGREFSDEEPLGVDDLDDFPVRLPLLMRYDGDRWLVAGWRFDVDELVAAQTAG